MRPKKTWESPLSYSTFFNKFLSRFLKPNLQRFFYSFVNLKSRDSSVDRKLFDHLSTLKKNGFVQLGNISSFSTPFYDYISSVNIHDQYSSACYDQNPFFKSINKSESVIENDGVGLLDLDLNSSVFSELTPLFSYVHSLVGSYYNHNHFWLRNSPLLRIDIENLRTEPPIFSYYHLDGGLRQLSLIIILGESISRPSSTELIISSNNSFRFLYEFANRKSKKFIRYCENKLRRFGSFKLDGPIGSVYLIDAGNTLHKGTYGGDRLILHFNFVQSASYCNYINPHDSAVSEYYFHGQQTPPFAVQKSLNYIC